MPSTALCRAEYAKTSKTLRRVATGIIVCFFLGFDILIKIPFRLYETILTTDVKYITYLGLKIFYVTKVGIIKIIYCLYIIRISLKTKRCLKESGKLRKNERSDKIFRSLVYFTLIPLFLSILFLGHDIPEAVHSLTTAGEKGCKKHDILIDWKVKICVTAIFVTLGSFAYGISYIVLFPNTRRGWTCCGK